MASVQEQLAMYRQRFGLEKAAAEQQSAPETFVPGAPQTEQSYSELFRSEAPTGPVEGTTDKMAKMAKAFTHDPIMNYKSEDLEKIVLGLRTSVEDPTSALDMDQAQKLLEKVLSKIDLDELGA